jgi:tRNA(Arg) A34 adenosine deaminase TadA
VNRKSVQSEHEDEKWISAAIEAARKGSEVGESPFGAVIVSAGRALAIAHNETNSSSNPTKHAEVVAIDRAIREHGAAVLESATLYSSCAPCLMCLGAAHYAGIRRLVYSLRISDVTVLGSGDPEIEPAHLASVLGLLIETRPDVERERALRLLQQVLCSRGSI